MELLSHSGFLLRCGGGHLAIYLAVTVYCGQISSCLFGGGDVSRHTQSDQRHLGGNAGLILYGADEFCMWPFSRAEGANASIGHDTQSWSGWWLAVLQGADWVLQTIWGLLEVCYCSVFYMEKILIKSCPHRFGMVMNQILSSSFFVQFGVSGVVFCCTAYLLSVVIENDFMYSI